MKISKIIFFAILFFALASPVWAQPEMQHNSGATHNAGTVSGSIVDANGVALEYATIYVKKTSDSLVAQYGITDSEGKFRIDGIPFGD